MKRQALIPAIVFLLIFSAAPALCGETAVVEVARVIDASAPGRAGQGYVDKLKADLEAELERYKTRVAKDKDAGAKVARKQAELSEQFRREYARVTEAVTAALREVIADWLKTNKQGVTVVLPAHEALGYAESANVSAEILRRLNSVVIDFMKK